MWCGRCHTSVHKTQHDSRVSFPLHESPLWATASSLWGFAITLTRSTFGGTRLHRSSVRREDLYQATNNTLKRQTDIHAPERFKPEIPASEQLKTHALDRAAPGDRLKHVSKEGVADCTASVKFLGASVCFAYWWNKPLSSERHSFHLWKNINHTHLFYMETWEAHQL